MGIKTIPLSRLEANLGATLSECADSGEPVVVELPDHRLIAIQVLEATEEEASLLAQEKAFFNARVDPRTRGRVGQPLQLAVDPARFHFFDPDTGDSLLAAKQAEQSQSVEEPLPIGG